MVGTGAELMAPERRRRGMVTRAKDSTRGMRTVLIHSPGALAIARSLVEGRAPAAVGQPDGVRAERPRILRSGRVSGSQDMPLAGWWTCVRAWRTGAHIHSRPFVHWGVATHRPVWTSERPSPAYQGVTFTPYQGYIKGISA